MTATPLRPEPLDVDMYREMYRGGAVNLAGFDPRLNATRIAQRLKVGRARVAGRLKAWNDSGFLARHDVWLNPALFGWQGAWLTVQVEQPRFKPALLARLALIDGAVSATEFLGEWVALGVLFPDPASLARITGLVRGLTGVRGVEPPEPWALPEPKRPLSPLDIRIVRALRENPTATLGATARRAGVSTRTMTRRYSALVDDGAVWFVPVLDFRSISVPAVSLVVTTRPGTGHEPLVRRIRGRYPLVLEFGSSRVGPEPAPDTHVLFVLPPSAAHLEELEQFVGSLDGVTGVEANVVVRVHSFPDWFDRHLDSLARRPTT